MKQFTLLVVFVLITVSVIWVFWVQPRSNDDSLVKQINKPGIEDVGLELEPQANQTQSTVTPPSIDGPSTRSIVNVPDSRQDSERTRHDNDQTFKQSVVAKIESALSGNLENAMDLIRLVRQCRKSPKNEGQLNARLRAIAGAKNPTPDMHDWLGFSYKVNSYEEWETIQLENYQHCQAVRGYLNDDLRSQFRELAKNGNVVARYLFAMWPPSSNLVIDEEALFNRVEYELDSLEFTWQNIEAKEPLGLLALGQSYLTPNHFTPSQHEMGVAFLLAAQTCGINNIWIEMIITNVGEFGVEQARLGADALVDRYCH